MNNTTYPYPLKKDSSGNEIYSKDLLNKEVYLLRGGKHVLRVGLNGEEFYAKDENGQEYYPKFYNYPNEIYRYAQMPDKSFKYAVANGRHLFPTDEDKNEMYITKVDFSKANTIPDRYAKTNQGCEYYPLGLNKDNKVTEVILHERYALDCNNVPLYPKDAYINEFYLPERDNTGAARRPHHMILKYYAASNDGKIILPAIDNQPYIDSTKIPLITQQNIVGRIIREANILSDFLTDVDSSKKPEIIPTEYKYEEISATANSTTQSRIVKRSFRTNNPFYMRWYFWVAIILSVISVLIAIRIVM